MPRRMLVVLGALLALVGWSLTPAGAQAAGTCTYELGGETHTVTNQFREEQGSTSLPDCRAYEMVSPADKNGGDVMAAAQRTRSAVSGNAVEFASLTGFGDVEGMGIAAEYIARRTGAPGTTGWATHSILPAVPPQTFLLDTHTQELQYQAEFSEDLSKAVLHSYHPLTSDPNVANVGNLYLRQDTLNSGSGSYALLSACPGCSGPLSDPQGTGVPRVDDATPDLGHIIFESGEQLTADAPPKSFFCQFGFCTPNLYEWDHGTLRFVGILPDGSTASNSQAGQGQFEQRNYTPNTISADGSKVFFTVSSFGFGSSGELYMRVDHSTTVQLNASERTDCAEHNPCSGTPEPDPAGHQEATFQTASPDGSKVFFTDGEALNNESGPSDLWVYDTTLPTSDPNHLRRVFVDEQPADGANGTNAVLGTSTDGSYLYFMSRSALLPGQPIHPVGFNGLYAWHNGTVAFVGWVDGNAQTADNVDRFWLSGLDARVTPDGHDLLFTAWDGSGLTGYNHGSTCFSLSVAGQGPCSELYRYDAVSGDLSCVSCNPSGATATSDATFMIKQSTGGAQLSSHLNRPMTDDGRHVFFETGEALLSQDTNGKSDVYEWTVEGAAGCGPGASGFSAQDGGCLSLITTGKSSEDSHFLEASPDGGNVFFTTSQRLVRWDTDNNADLYDARVGGGFPEPPVPATECSGEACQGALSTQPSGSSFGSAGAVAGAENLSPATAPAPKRKAQTPKQALAKALKACRTKHDRAGRRRCEAQARKRYKQAIATRKGTR